MTALTATAIATVACSRTPTTTQAAAPQAPLIVQPGAPGQDSTVVKQVPAFQDANEYTADDVKFMQGMMHHHNQALLMAAMIPTHTTTLELQELGKKITISQSGEIEMMKQWLVAHHQTVPMLMSDGTAMMGNMDMGAMPGMLSPEEMKKLDAARGGEFDYLFLTGMIKHHQGALTMVSDLRAAGGGVQPSIADYIAGVDNDQRAEIARMQGLLGGVTK